MLVFYLFLLGLLSGVNGGQECRCPCDCSNDDTYICEDKSDPNPCLIAKEFPMMETSGSCLDIGGLCQGRRVTIAGTVTDEPERFTTNFMTADGQVALHFDVRIKFGALTNTLVMTNNQAGKGWAPETRLAFDARQFAPGQDYELAFLVDGDKFKITNRGEELTSYTLPAAISWEDITQVCVLRDTNNITVSLDNPSDISEDKSEDPCLIAKEFPMMETSGSCLDIGGLCQGRRLTIAGTVTDEPERFTTNFMTADGQLALHFDVRIKFGALTNTLVMTNNQAGKGWAPETRLPFDATQFAPGQDYELAFLVDGDNFTITNRGEELTSYTLPAAISWEDITQVCVLRDTSNITLSLDNPSGDLLTPSKRDDSTVSGECPSPFELIDGSCYYFNEAIREKRDFLWKAARNECQGLAENADLVTIETEDQFNMITAQLHERYPTPTNINFWTGARFCKGRAIWVATKEETNLPRTIEPYPVTEENNCGRIYYSSKGVYTHRGLTCTKLHSRRVGYVCEMKPQAIEPAPFKEDVKPIECSCSCGCENANASVCGQLTEPNRCLIARDFPIMETSGQCLVIGSLCEGRRITIKGTVCDKFDRFTITFLTENNDVALNFDIRKIFGNFKEKIAMNSRMDNESYNYALKQSISFPEGEFPFAAGQDYELAFTVEGEQFKITEDGNEIGSFKLRDPMTWASMNRLCLNKCTGNITVSLDNI